MALPLTVISVPGPGAEDVLVTQDGRVWTGTGDGGIHVHDPATGQTTTVAATGGRPLGLEELPDGRILVCDAHAGLLALDPATGDLEVLVSEVDGTRLLFTNNAAVAADGTIWFTDSSQKWTVEEWKNDLIDHTCSGRLLRRDPDGSVEIVLEGLAFANGVALAADESAVYVAETALRRIQRVRLTGPDAGTATIWASDLPGYPDNTARGSDGLIWVALASPPDPVLGLLQRSPDRLRSAARRLPAPLQPKPRRTARVLGLNEFAAHRHDLTMDASRWHMVTGVREVDGVLWLGSLVEPAIACAQIPQLDRS